MEVNIDLHFLNIGDLQYNIQLFKLGFESRTMKYSENGGHFDLNFLHLGDLQYDLHLFSTRIWV